MIEEPSVLDYLKDKLAFWRRSQVQIPEDPDPAPSEAAPREKRRLSWGGRQSWLVPLPFIFAITAQIFSEPDSRSPSLVLFFYAAAGLGFALLILFRNWDVDSLPADKSEAGEFRFRWINLLVGSGISILAFFFFTGNLFNTLNILLWVAGLVLIWNSLWVRQSWLPRLKEAWQKFLDRGVQITPWTLLVVAVFLVSGFYRLYLLDQVPPEMFSDHAEKLIDVSNVLRGEWYIFFPRNTGREAFQMYLTAAMSRLFGTGISFLSLKLGTCLAGVVSLPFIYLLGKEIKSREVGLLAMFFAGIAYWPNVISRVALRFALYPAFTAPVLFFLVRGIKHKRWNDFLFAGLALGIGLHGYSPFRVVPLAVVAMLLIYFLHTKSPANRRMAVIALLLVGLISLIIFLPLGRYAVSSYDLFSYRMKTRLSGIENPLSGSPAAIFLTNMARSLIMFQWDNGQIWVHSIPGRPALEVVSAAMFSLGVILLAARYLKRRHWIDLSLLVLIPLLMLPSALSLAFPAENPSLNRSGGALVPVFLVVALAIENLVLNLKAVFQGQAGRWIARIAVVLLAVVSLSNNARLVFHDYYSQFKLKAWNTSEIGGVIRHFAENIGHEDQAYVVPYPHWVDTRLVGIHAVGRVVDFALWQPDIQFTTGVPAPKLFIFKPEDSDTLSVLENLYPDGIQDRYHSEVEGRDFLLYYVLQ